MAGHLQIRRLMRVSQAMPCSPVGLPSRRARLILASVLLLVEENSSPYFLWKRTAARRIFPQDRRSDYL